MPFVACVVEPEYVECCRRSAPIIGMAMRGRELVASGFGRSPGYRAWLWTSVAVASPNCRSSGSRSKVNVLSSDRSSISNIRCQVGAFVVERVAEQVSSQLVVRSAFVEDVFGQRDQSHDAHRIDPARSRSAPRSSCEAWRGATTRARSRRTARSGRQDSECPSLRSGAGRRAHLQEQLRPVVLGVLDLPACALGQSVRSGWHGK